MPGLLAHSVVPTKKVQAENAQKYTAETAHSWWLTAKVTRQVTGRSIINTFPSIQKLATSCGQQRLAPEPNPAEATTVASNARVIAAQNSASVLPPLPRVALLLRTTYPMSVHQACLRVSEWIIIWWSRLHRWSRLHNLLGRLHSLGFWPTLSLLKWQ